MFVRWSALTPEGMCSPMNRAAIPSGGSGGQSCAGKDSFSADDSAGAPDAAVRRLCGRPWFGGGRDRVRPARELWSVVYLGVDVHHHGRRQIGAAQLAKPSWSV